MCFHGERENKKRGKERETIIDLRIMQGRLYIYIYIDGKTTSAMSVALNSLQRCNIFIYVMQHSFSHRSSYRHKLITLIHNHAHAYHSFIVGFRNS